MHSIFCKNASYKISALLRSADQNVCTVMAIQNLFTRKKEENKFVKYLCRMVLHLSTHKSSNTWLRELNAHEIPYVCRWKTAQHWCRTYMTKIKLGRCSRLPRPLLMSRFWKASDLKVEMENLCRRRSRVYFKHRHPVTISRKAKSCSRREKELVGKQ